MAKNVKFKLDLDGLREIMKSKEMIECLEAGGKAVKDVAGSGYEMDTITRDYIAITRVAPATSEARRENLKENTLLKALGSVGLRMTKG